jgi:photosystem II stability/assembly factor-like uncharacterized protein
MRSFAAVLILLASALPASAGVGAWTPLGPDGGEVSSLVADSSDPETAYAGTAAGLYKTSDGGQSWSQLRPEWALLLGLAGDTLYVDFLFDDGLVKSTDGGQTWTPASTLPADVFRVVADPRKPSRVWATGRTIYLSEDGGATWRALARPKGSAKDLLSELAFEPAGQGLYAAFTNGVFRSPDLGKTWQRGGRVAGKAELLRHLAVGAGNPPVLYAATDNGLFRSLNRGNKWQRIGAVALKGHILDILTAGGRVYVSVEGAGIFYSSNQGATWTRGIGSPPHTRHLAAAPGVLYAGTAAIGEPGGPYRSLDSGATWERVSNGVRALSVTDVAVDPANPDVLYASAGSSGLLRSTDRGATWEIVNLGNSKGDPLFGVSRVLFDAASIYALGANFRSDDGGETWQRFEDPPLPYVLSIVLDPRQPGALWASGLGLAHSDDRGEHWTPVGVSELSDLFLYTVQVDPRDPRVLYVAGHTQPSGGGDPETVFPRLLRSADGGATWQRRDAGIEADAISDLALDPAAPDTLYAATNTGLFRSTDAGQTWALSGLHDWVETVVAAPTTPTTIYADVDGRGIQRSIDGGQTWTPVDTGGRGRLRLLAIDPHDPDRIYAGAFYGGIFTYETP